MEDRDLTRRSPQLAQIRSNVDGVVWPPMPTGRAGSLAGLVDELDATQWLPQQRIISSQFEQLAATAEILAHTSPSFRRRLSRADVRHHELGTPDGLARLPLLSRREIIDEGAGFFATAMPRGHGPVAPALTSGSTGVPVTVRRTALTALVWEALTIRDHLWRPLDFSERLFAHRLAVKSPVDQDDWGPPASSLYESGRLRALPLATPVDEVADQIVAFDPQLALLYPSVLDALLTVFRRRDRRPTSLRLWHNLSEPLSPSLRAAAAEELGVTVWDTYTCEEIGNVTASCPSSDAYHVLAEGVLVEVLDDQGEPCPVGSIGRIVITDLLNAASPMIRYDIGDYAEVVPACGCGRGLPSIGRVVGRERNRLRLTDGALVWPRLDALSQREAVPPIRSVQLVQRADGTIDVVASVDREPNRSEWDALGDRVHEALGAELPLRFAIHDGPLPRSRGGKFEPFRRED